MAKADYYDILGIQKNASKEQIKQAYKDLAKKYHPDISKEKNAEERFKQISEAYAVLSDDQKRAAYDQFGHEAFDQRYSREDIFRDFDFDVFRDIFSNGNSPFESIFETFFGRGARAERDGGEHLRYDLGLTLEEAYHGCEKKISIQRNESCQTCKGHGSKDGKETSCPSCQGTGQTRKTSRSMFGILQQIMPCRDCNGEGRVIQNPCKDCMGTGVELHRQEIKVKIPGGVDNGAQVRLRGEGGVSSRRGEKGDLFIVIHILPDKRFEREGNDLYTEAKISFATACLGGSLEVPTLDKPATLKIPLGTQPGTAFRMRNAGMPDLHHRGHGDLYVTIKVEVPEKLTKEQQELLRRFEKTGL